jgi:hypothetical protein
MYKRHEFKVNKILFLFLDLSIPHTIGAILVIDTRGKLLGKPRPDRIGLSELNKSALDDERRDDVRGLRRGLRLGLERVQPAGPG